MLPHRQITCWLHFSLVTFNFQYRVFKHVYSVLGLTILELASQYLSPFQNYLLLCFHYFSQRRKQIISVFVILNPYYQIVEFFGEINDCK